MNKSIYLALFVQTNGEKLSFKYELISLRQSLTLNILSEYQIVKLWKIKIYEDYMYYHLEAEDLEIFLDMFLSKETHTLEEFINLFCLFHYHPCKEDKNS